MTVLVVFKCFQLDMSKICLFGIELTLTLYSIDTHFDTLTTVFENIVGKGEIARNEHFLLFPQCLLLNQITVSQIVHIFDILILYFYLLPNWKSLKLAYQV